MPESTAPERRIFELNLACPACGAAEFAFRIDADAQAALVACEGCERNWFVLDSRDHWYDVTQEPFPRPRACSCRAKRWRIELAYIVSHVDVVHQVELRGTCASCARPRRLGVLEIAAK